MDWDTLWASLVISFVLTIFGYLLVPIVLALSGKKYSEKKVKRITITNCVVVWFLFRILQISLGNDASSGAAVFLWGAVGHWILKKYCLIEPSLSTFQTTSPNSSRNNFESEKNIATSTYENCISCNSDVVLKQDMELPSAEPALSAQQVKPQHEPIVSQQSKYPSAKYCTRCGHIIDQKTKKCTSCGKQYFKGFSKKTIIITLLSVILFISLAHIISLKNTITVLQQSNDELQNSIVDLTDKNQELTKTNDDLLKRNNSLNTKIANLRKENSTIQAEKDEYYNFWVDNFYKVYFIDTYIAFVADDGTWVYHT